MSRKTAKKLQLIQWSCFQNETVNMGGSTLFTGVNGSGKSTILDAISYLITANTQFNLAAKDRDRTVKGYVRGDTKSNGDNQYLRKNEVVCYVAMEFESEIDASSFVIGVCIESPNSTDSCSSNWFILKDTKLRDIKMSSVENGELVVYPKKLLKVRGSFLKSSDFMGREKAKSQILRVLGLRCEPDKYRNKLVKMMAFNPENNVDQFIQNCVLEPGKVDSLKELRSQKEKFEELKGVFENLKICKEKLDFVAEKTFLYEKTNYSYLNRSLMLRYQEMLHYINEKEEIKRRRDFYILKKQTLEREFKDISKKKENAQDRLNSARSNSDYASAQRSIEAIDRQLQGLESEIEKNRNDIEQLRNLVKTIHSLKEELGEEWICSASTEKVLFELGEKTYSPDEGWEAVNALTDTLAKTRKKLIKKEYDIEREEEGIEQTRSEVLQNLRELENRIIPYPQEYIEVKNILKRELEKTYKNVNVRFFAELISEIKDTSWRKAIETFLGKKRFYLMVDDDCVEEAMRILKEYKLYATNLVITDKIPASEITPESAASVLEIPNPSARRYANYLLNGIHLCADIEELHEFPKGGLTKEGMLAKSYSVALMDMRKIRCYIGNDAIDLQIKEYQKEYDEILEKQKKLKEEITIVSKRSQQIQEADIDVRLYHFDAPCKIDENEKELRESQAAREKLCSDPGFLAIQSEIDRCKVALSEIEKKGNDIGIQIGQCKEGIEREEQSEKKNAASMYTSRNEYEEYKNKYPEIEKEMISDYEKIRSRDPEKIRVIQGGTVEKLRTERDRAIKAMEDAQLDYLKAAGQNLERRGLSFIPFFNEEQRLLSNVKLEEASNKLEKHAKDMESTFMSDFVAEMNESIINAKKEVESINTELKHLPFGNDTYAFVMEERGDRAEFFRICAKLNEYISKDMFQSMSVDNEELSNDIRMFMDKILKEQDESEYTDYRKYFKYDMKIRTKKGDLEIEADFSKKQGSASNGEKQTPYFIILAASLIQCYPKDSECAKLALIDEAFAALSRERIEQMVKYLEDNNFQVMYAAPPEKIASIGDLINTTVSLVSTGRYTKMIEGLVKL